MDAENTSAEELTAELRDEIAGFTLKVCEPLYWHDRSRPWPKNVRGGRVLYLNGCQVGGFGGSYTVLEINRIIT